MVLAGFCAGLFAIFWQTIDLDQPKWQFHEGLIGTSPGIGFRPMPPAATVSDSALIWYRSSQPHTMEYWYDAMDRFFEGNCW